MSLLARRIIVAAGAAVKDPKAPDAPQKDLVQGGVGIRLDPVAIERSGETPLPFIPDLFDVIVEPTFDDSAYVKFYEAELQQSGEIIVKRDLFGEHDCPHTFSGWPIPGDPKKPPEIAPGAADFEMLAKAKLEMKRSK